jgi:hypothetical protein
MAEKIVLIVGAGAGVSFKFPTGQALMDQLSKALNFGMNPSQWQRGDQLLYRNLFGTMPAGDRSRMLTLGQQMAEGILYFRSIDEYLFSRDDDPSIVLMGKAAIAACIARKEVDSRLSKIGPQMGASDRLAVMSQFNGSWIHTLFGHLSVGMKRATVDALFKNIAIINFNYDRCVEQYLFWATQQAFGVDADAAAQAMDHLQIIHPYGQVGTLPWQKKTGVIVPFGTPVEEISFSEVAKNIYTYAEQRRDISERSELGKLIDGAKHILFLGFGFHKQNMDLLRLSDEFEQKNRPVTGTAYLTSEEDRGVFVSLINASFKRPAVYSGPNLFDMDCEGLLTKVGLSLWRQG